MFLHDGREGNTYTWADNIDRTLFSSDDEIYRYIEKEGRRSIGMEPTTDGIEVYSVPSDFPDITLEEAKNGYENRQLAKKGWVLESHNDLRTKSVWVNENTGEARLMFWYHGQGPTEPQDNKLVFKDIPLNRSREIMKHTQFSPHAETEVRETVEWLRARGLDVEFTGYSSGGYAATKWGSEMNINVDTLNAHIMPYNQFANTNARISHHTTANDRTNFKYTGGDAITSDSFASHDHTVYSGQEGATGVFESHAVNQFHEPNIDVQTGMKRFNAMGNTHPIESTANTALNVLSFTDAAFDAAQGDYKRAGKEAVEAGLFIANPLAGQEVLAGEMGLQSVTDWQAGKKGAAVRHGLEAAAMAGAPAGGPLAMLSIDEGVSAIEQAYQASDWAKLGNKNMAGLVGTESALNMLGAVSTPATEGLGVVVFGGLSQLVHIAERAERLREENHLKKQISDLNAEYSDQLNKNKAAATYVGGTLVARCWYVYRKTRGRCPFWSGYK